MRQESFQNFEPRGQPEDDEKARDISKRPNELLAQVRDVANYVFEYKAYHQHDWLDKVDGGKLEQLRDMFGAIKHEEGLSIETRKSLGEEDSAYAILGYYEHAHPELKKIYLDILQEVRKEQEAKIKQKLKRALANVEVDENAKSNLDQHTISLEREQLTPEQTDLLKESLPSGNILLHTTNVDSTIQCIKSGNLLSTAEVSLIKERDWKSEMQEGISFNMNHVQVLTGDERHFIGFLVAPEAVLNDQTQLAVPYDASRYEAQLVPRPYVRPKKYSGWNSQPKIEKMREGLPRVAIEDTFILCNEGDAESIKKLLAGHGHIPKAILTYPRNELRIRSWNQPVGDHQVADKLLTNMLAQAKIKPTIDWEKDVFPEGLELERDNVFVSNKSVEQSRCIIIDDRGLPGVANCNGK